MLVDCSSLPYKLLGFPNKLLVPIYTPGWREVMWELSVFTRNTTQCPPTRDWTWTTQYRDNCTNHKIPALPLYLRRPVLYCLLCENTGLIDWIARCGNIRMYVFMKPWCYTPAPGQGNVSSTFSTQSFLEHKWI